MGPKSDTSGPVREIKRQINLENYRMFTKEIKSFHLEKNHKRMATT